MARSTSLSYSFITIVPIAVFNAIWIALTYWLMTLTQIVDLERSQWSFIFQGSIILTLACVWFAQSTASPIIPRTGAALMIVLSASALYLVEIAIFRSYFSRTALGVFPLITIAALFCQAYLVTRQAAPKIGLVSSRGLNAIPSEARANVVLADIERHPAINWDVLVVDFDTTLDTKQQHYISQAVLADIQVVRSTLYSEHATGRVRYENARQIFSILPGAKALWSQVKPLFESALIILSAPLWMIVLIIGIIAVRLDSPGPVFFVQERVGKGGKPFKVFKLRTMKPSDGKAQFAAVDDVRITKVGAYMRKMRIDEIPQFFNVLQGNMALIGPRPEQVEFAEEFSQTIPFYALRHSVLPGITGWAQTNSGYAADETSTREKLEYDLYYIRNQSFALDFYIVVRTLNTILTGFGSR